MIIPDRESLDDDILYPKTLKAKTHKGKNVLNKWGDLWEIIEIRQSNLLIKSQKDISGDFHTLPDSVRWIKKSEDPDFDVME